MRAFHCSKGPVLLRACSALYLLLLCSFCSHSNAKLRFPSLRDIFAKADEHSANLDVPPSFIAGVDPIPAATKAGATVNQNPLLQALPSVDPLIQLYHVLANIVLYQPPVGLVTLWVSVAWSRQMIFRTKKQPGSESALVAKAAKLDRHTGRALDLDPFDLQYQKFGGIERVRRRLLYKVLQEEDQDATTALEVGEDEGVKNYALYRQALKQVLEATFSPGGSHSDFVYQQLDAMTNVEQYYWEWNHSVSSSSSSFKPSPAQLHILKLAHQTAQVRMMDAMLRLTRDRLLRTIFRLSRTVQHWQRRVQTHTQIAKIPPWARQYLWLGGLDGDRMRLAFAEAAYAKEIVKLGKVVKLLLDRPKDMDDSALELAVQATMEMEKQISSVEDTTTTAKERRTKRMKKSATASLPPTTNKNGNGYNMFWPKLSNMAVRFNADGRGKLALQFYEDSLDIGAKGALQVVSNEDHGEWLEESTEWARQGRALLCDVIQETVDTSIPTSSAMQARLDLQILQGTWRTGDYNAPQEIAICWKAIFEKLRELHQYRRVGDGKTIKLKNSNLVHWFRQFDLLGIPSALLKILLAHYLHSRLHPYYPNLTKLTKESYDIVHEIVTTRFYGPVKDLLTELMYRPANKLMEGITVADEEQSLDNMLRDSNFGDGTPEGRHDGIIKAMRQYEHDMNSGMVWNSGRLIRLILIQVQQLKCATLHATDTVDLLFQANRFNIQLLTIIPAIVIVWLGTKLFVRALFTVRVKDLRPMSSVHAKMTEYLNNLESILLLATHRGGGDTSKKGGIAACPATEALTDGEFGEFVNTLYDYLVLLDYSSPQPFPSWQCDGIHQSVTECLYSMKRLTLDDQVQLIDQVKRKHRELAKHL